MSPPEVLDQVDSRGVMWLNLPAPRVPTGGPARGRSPTPSRDHWAAQLSQPRSRPNGALRGHDARCSGPIRHGPPSLTTTTIPQTVIIWTRPWVDLVPPDKGHEPIGPGGAAQGLSPDGEHVK